MKGLNPKQSAFVAEYLKDKNATQAAIRAGYSKKTAVVQGPRLLGNVLVREAIMAGQAKVEKRAEVDAAWILAGFKEIADRCLQRVPVFDENGEEVGVWKFDSSGANKALESLGRTMALFTDRHEVTVAPELMRLIVSAFSEAALAAAPESCPHCKTRLDLPAKIAAELLKVSEKLRITSGARA